VKPEAASFLDKARTLPGEAEAILAIHLNESAGRTAYLAGYHAAQAFVLERTGKSPKTHRGVHTEFLRHTKDDPRLDPDLRLFLSSGYNLEAIADYETGPGAKVSKERATSTIEADKRFVAWVVESFGSDHA